VEQPEPVTETVKTENTQIVPTTPLTVPVTAKTEEIKAPLTFADLVKKSTEEKTASTPAKAQPETDTTTSDTTQAAASAETSTTNTAKKPARRTQGRTTRKTTSTTRGRKKSPQATKKP
ncbi:hypothetical protein, partial [Oceanospirillum sediminis]